MEKWKYFYSYMDSNLYYKGIKEIVFEFGKKTMKATSCKDRKQQIQLLVKEKYYESFLNTFCRVFDQEIEVLLQDTVFSSYIEENVFSYEYINAYNYPLVYFALIDYQLDETKKDMIDGVFEYIFSFSYIESFEKRTELEVQQEKVRQSHTRSQREDSKQQSLQSLSVQNKQKDKIKKLKLELGMTREKFEKEERKNQKLQRMKDDLEKKNQEYFLKNEALNDQIEELKKSIAELTIKSSPTTKSYRIGEQVVFTDEGGEITEVKEFSSKGIQDEVAVSVSLPKRDSFHTLVLGEQEVWVGNDLHTITYFTPFKISSFMNEDFKAYDYVIISTSHVQVANIRKLKQLKLSNMIFCNNVDEVKEELMQIAGVFS